MSHHTKIKNLLKLSTLKCSYLNFHPFFLISNLCTARYIPDELEECSDIGIELNDRTFWKAGTLAFLPGEGLCYLEDLACLKRASKFLSLHSMIARIESSRRPTPPPRPEFIYS